MLFHLDRALIWQARNVRRKIEYNVGFITYFLYIDWANFKFYLAFISRKKKNSPKLWIAECILEEESYSKYKNLKEESKEELKEDYSIDL